MDSPNCGKVGEWVTAEELQNNLYPGDLIEMDRGQGTREFIKHWAVCLQNEGGNAIIINVTGDVLSGLGAVVGSRKTIADVRVERFVDSVGKSPCRVNNSIDEKYQPFATGDIVVKRGLSKLGEHDYSVWSSNCEHFSSWCRNGRMESTQAEEAEKKVADLKATPDVTKQKAQNKLEELKSKLDDLKLKISKGPPPPPGSMKIEAIKIPDNVLEKMPFLKKFEQDEQKLD